MPAAPNRRVHIVAMSLTAALGIALAVAWSQWPGANRPDESPATDPAATDPNATARSALEVRGEVAIEENGRMILDAASLPSDGPLNLALAMPDEARGDGVRSVRIVSVDGRKLDVTSEPAPGDETGIRLAIDPTFLKPGLYLIHVETAEQQALHFRRFVLELR